MLLPSKSCALVFLLAAGCAALSVDLPKTATLEAGVPAEIEGGIDIWTYGTNFPGQRKTVRLVIDVVE